MFQVLFSSYSLTTDITTDKYQDKFVNIALLADKKRSVYIGTLSSCQPPTSRQLTLFQNLLLMGKKSVLHKNRNNMKVFEQVQVLTVPQKSALMTEFEQYCLCKGISFLFKHSPLHVFRALRKRSTVNLINIISLTQRWRSKFIQRKNSLPETTQKIIRHQNVWLGKRQNRVARLV